MPHDAVLNLISLARKAGRLETGEEPAGAACRARQAKVLLVASDASPNTFRRAAHFARAGGVPCLELPCDKSGLGGVAGRGSCAIAAVTDAGFAAAIAKQLSQQDPDRYQAASLQLEEQASRALQRQEEERRHEKNLSHGGRRIRRGGAAAPQNIPAGGIPPAK